MRFLFGLNPDATTVWRSSLFTVRLLSLVMASVAFAGVLWVTGPQGPGLQTSSAAYLGAAESLVDGRGLRAPTAPWDSADSTARLTHYPPGYPIAIAVPQALGLPGTESARLVQALAAFVTVAVLVAVVGDAAGVGTAAAFGLALLVMPVMVDTHLSVLSEPLFFALLALTLGVMVAAPEAAFAAGLCAAGALLVRFTGVSAAIAVALWMVVGRPSWRAAWRRAAVALAPTAALAAGWLWIARGSALGAMHGLRLHDGLAHALGDGAMTVAQWLAPAAPGASWSWLAAVAVGAAMLAVLVAGTRRVRRLWQLLPKELPLRSSTNVPQLVAARVLGACALLAGAYAAVVVGARLFAAGDFTFDARIMSPLLLLVAVAFAVAAAGWWRSARRELRAGLIVLLVAWGAAAFVASRNEVRQSLGPGLDLANDAWSESPLLEWVRGDGNRRPLYSNWPAVPYLYLGRPVRGVPSSSDAATLRAFGDSVRARGGLVLAFTAADPPAVPVDSLAVGSGLQVLARYPGGVVLGPARSVP